MIYKHPLINCQISGHVFQVFYYEDLFYFQVDETRMNMKIQYSTKWVIDLIIKNCVENNNKIDFSSTGVGVKFVTCPASPLYLSSHIYTSIQSSYF